jgi:hypothetical protein
VRDRLAVDMSHHCPHGLEATELKAYDYVVAMDPYVAKRLREDYHILDFQLVEWNIRDPYLQGRAAYERCADEISEAISRLESRLNATAQRSSSLTSEVSASSASEVSGSLSRLRQEIERWKSELTSGEIRGTLLQGIAKEAVEKRKKGSKKGSSPLLALDAREICRLWNAACYASHEIR